MMTAGIAGDRIATAGYGPDNPLAPNDTEEGRARNRRTELVVLKR
jgi:outer membrane protein OmpA-like peptidoglycan-associated protein